MLKFEIYLNSIENSGCMIYTRENAKEINRKIFDILTTEHFGQTEETAIECAGWAELATDGEDWTNNDITIICHVEK